MKGVVTEFIRLVSNYRYISFVRVCYLFSCISFKNKSEITLTLHWRSPHFSFFPHHFSHNKNSYTGTWTF